MNKYEKQVEQLQLNKEKQVLRDLKTMYRKALDGVNEMIVMLMSDPTSKSKAYQAKYQAALKRQIETLLDVLQNKEFDTINEFLKESYDNGYIGTMYAIKEQGIPLMLPISQEQVIKAIQLDSKISKGLYERLGEDVKELKKKIRSEVSRGISTGMSYTDMSRNISNVSNVGINNAMRIARTESHRIKGAASYDAALEAKKKGADIVLQWDATLDGKTRQRHKRIDGEIRELGETFSNGLRYPGDENGAAAEVINCRCIALTRARWGLDEEELKELERRAEYFELDKTKDFEEYKRKYLKVENDIAKDKLGIFSNNNKANPHYYDYKGKDIKTVESEISQLNYEVGVIFDRQGKGISCQLGNEDTIKFTKHQLKLMMGADITHNHPLSTPPSPEDLYLMIDNKANSFRTCGKDGTYVLKSSREIELLPDFNVFSEKYDEYLTELQPTYIAKVQDGMKHEEALSKLGEAIWDKLFEIYGVKPIFERRNE